MDSFWGNHRAKWGILQPLLEPILVGGLEHVFFHSVENLIIPTDEVILFRGVGEKPPTRMIISILQIIITDYYSNNIN